MYFILLPNIKVPYTFIYEPYGSGKLLVRGLNTPLPIEVTKRCIVKFAHLATHALLPTVQQAYQFYLLCYVKPIYLWYMYSLVVFIYLD